LGGLKGKTVSVPFGSTAHGMLLRALKKQGIDPEKDLTLVSQSPEIGGSSLQSHKIDGHADFVPFAELFPYRGFAKKIYDGSDANTPTFHGTLVNADFAKKYPEIVVAFLRATLEADRLVASDPEKYSELIAKTTGIDAEVNYLFLGPLGVQTRDSSFKPEYRQAIKTAIETLTLLKRNDVEISSDELVDDRYIREAYKKSGLSYEKQLTNYAKQPLNAKDDRTGESINDFSRVTQVWFVGEPKVRNYSSPESALFAIRDGEKNGKKIRAVYVVDKQSGLKLLGNLAWYVRNPNGQIDAYLQKDSADIAAKKTGGSVVTFTTTFSVAEKNSTQVKQL